jgi:hypothetical protein
MADTLDVKYEFERWMSQCGESAVYIGDGLYSTGSACEQAEAFRAGVEIGRAAALASRPAEVDDKIPRESNDALIAMAKYWKLDGDWMTCKGCRRSLIASRDGEELAHGEGCKYWNQQHPWAQLRELIARRPAPAGGAQ